MAQKRGSARAMYGGCNAQRTRKQQAMPHWGKAC